MPASPAVGALQAGGDVGRDLLAVDWAATPLGPPDGWSQSLTTVVSVMLRSRFAMWMAWGPELTFLCNDAYRRDTLGAKYPWALGRPAHDVWAEIWPEIGPRIASVMATGEATWDEALLLFLERSGYPEETYHTFSYSPLTDDDGAIAGMLCVVSEDTERVVAERRMATLRDLGADPAAVRSEDELFTVVRRHLGANLHSLPFTLVYLLAEDGTAHLRCSTGMPPGHPAAPLLVDAGDPAPRWPVTAAAGGRTVVEDLRERFADLPTGAWDVPPSQAVVVPLVQQGHGRPFGFLVAALNPHRRLDDDYRGFVELVAGQLSAGIASARAYEAERERAEQLAELDQAKTAFFTNVSHELRTPLTLLLGPAEDALADAAEPLSPAQRRRVELIGRNAERLLKLVNTLLDFSRLESGRATGRFEAIDLALYTAELASMFRAATDRAGIELVVDCEPAAEPVFVDREMWAKIVLNLVSNALKFTFDGHIAVRLRQVGGAVELAVEDTGIGIAESEQADLFKRFHRVDGARSRSHEGSGIGLALVAELAALHGGEVAVESAPGRGSRFSVTIPRGEDHLPGGAVAPEDTLDVSVEQRAQDFVAEAIRWLQETTGDQAADAGAERGQRARVLVVDDNADMRDYVRELLAPHFDVALAPDGAEALAMVRADPPDLVLTDVMMPRLDGFGLLRELRADRATMHIPVVMLSARAGDDGTVEGLEAGADDYLVKPFSARELLARVQSNLELDRVRRARDELDRSRALLDQAERLAHVGSWEVEVATGRMKASAEYLRMTRITGEELATLGVEGAIARLVPPADRDRVTGLLSQGIAKGEVTFETRIAHPDVGDRLVLVRAEVVRDDAGEPVLLRGSVQDVTEQRAAERAEAEDVARREASAREHRIADELQQSLLPPRTFDPDRLEVATFYRAGAEGTQVGGDWYDVIQMDGGCTALVIGDVMGRGVRAAAVMGQIRAAVRAYARLSLAPAEVLRLLDGVVGDLDSDQIVTCIYATYDPETLTLRYASAGHLPPLLAAPGERARVLPHAGGPPLGTGLGSFVEHEVQLSPGALLALFTDGLVERRDRDLPTGLEEVAAALTDAGDAIEALPAALVAALVPDEVDDDVAVLIACVPREC